MFTTIKAKFAASCKRCGGEIAVGQKMRYGGRGRTYHLKAECSVGSVLVAASDVVADVEAMGEDEASARSYTPRGVSHYTRFSSGAEVFVNKRGRCEDAPCCGCCS